LLVAKKKHLLHPQHLLLMLLLLPQLRLPLMLLPQLRLPLQLLLLLSQKRSNSYFFEAKATPEVAFFTSKAF
jgi:hypothetical protein